MFIVQAAILIAIAYLLGCVVGSFLRKSSGPEGNSTPGAKAETLQKKGHAAITTDDLKQIRGIGPKIEERLNQIGITSFAQIAAWKPKDQREIDEQLAFKGRIKREGWVRQAKMLTGKGKA